MDTENTKKILEKLDKIIEILTELKSGDCECGDEEGCGCTDGCGCGDKEK